MAAADARRLDAAPTRRQDIISAILSDYADRRDPDEDDVELDDYYTQAQPSPAAAALPVQSAPVSPVVTDKPLPPLVGFQLRGGCALVPLLKTARSSPPLAFSLPGRRAVNTALRCACLPCYFRDMAIGAV